MADIRGFVSPGRVGTAADGSRVGVKTNRRGELVVMDFFTQMALEQRVFQVKAGTVTTPLTGDVVITNSAAEMCADASTGLTIIPCQFNASIRLATGTLHEYALKSIGSLSTAGTAFVPLNLYIGGLAPRATARVQAAGAVSVGAELATTTTRHWSYSNPVAAAAGSEPTDYNWAPLNPPTLVGPSCFYVQIAATTTGPDYYASFDFVELPTAAI